MLNGITALFRSLFRGHAAMMVLCIGAMVGIFVLFSGGVGEAGWASLLLPLGACLLMHIVMHGAMGHGTHEPRDRPAEPDRRLVPAKLAAPKRHPQSTD